MHLVRRALRSADAEKTTVTEIAIDYRFWELGRFAVAYQSLLFRRSALGGTASAPEDAKPDEIIEPAWKFLRKSRGVHASASFCRRRPHLQSARI